MRISLAAQNGLDGLGHYSPAVVEVTADALFVEQELAQSLQRALEGNQRMA